EDRVGFRKLLGEGLAVALGETTGRHHLRAGIRRLEQGVDGLLLRLLDEPARVDEDDVGAFTVGSDLPAVTAQATSELLRVHLVASTTEGEQGNPAASARARGRHRRWCGHPPREPAT